MIPGLSLLPHWAACPWPRSTVSIMVSFEIGKCESPSLFLFRIVLAVPNPPPFHVNPRVGIFHSHRAGWGCGQENVESADELGERCQPPAHEYRLFPCEA